MSLYYCFRSYDSKIISYEWLFVKFTLFLLFQSSQFLPPYSCFPFLLPWSFVENEEKYLNRIREIENKLYQPHGNPSSSRNFLRKYGDIKSSFLKTLGWRQRSFVAREISRARVLKGARESRGRPSLEYF